MNDSERQVALVTGGSRGIGYGCAENLVAAGFDLAINGIRSEKLIAADLDRLRRTGRQVIYCQGDVAARSDRNNMLAKIREHFGSLNVLINNAGVAPKQRLDIIETTEESYDHVLDINLKGAFLTARSAIRIMREHGSGAIVMISSLAGQTGGVHAGLDYAASKGGVIALTKALMKRALPYGIRVNCVNPGVIDTAMTRAFPPEVRKQIAEQHPLHRWGTAREVANTVVFLASEASNFVNGHVLLVDGGWIAA